VNSLQTGETLITRAMISRAAEILKAWKGDAYSFGEDVLGRVGGYAAGFGSRAVLLASSGPRRWNETSREQIEAGLKAHGLLFEVVQGARPNCPREDVYRIGLHVARSGADVIVALGGGSTLDAAKAAAVLNSYSPSRVMDVLGADLGEADSIDPYFGTGMVTRMKEATGKSVMPVVAVQTAASSAAHLTKYSNITNPVTGQKKLIIDDAIVPPAAVFDYGITIGSPASLTLDGAFDGIAHAWEVFMGARGPNYSTIKEAAELSIRLIVGGLTGITRCPSDPESRTALGLGTDLGGYLIMLGGTSGPHLGSFSLVDILSHGRACAVLNPYYTVLFSPRIQDQLRTMGAIFQDAGLLQDEVLEMTGRDLGLAVARGMISFARDLSFPATLKEAGVTRDYVQKMIDAAKDPQLKSKLQNMPAPMDADAGDVERLMKPVLEAAFEGDLDRIP
jgi:alcohol dehydrogenase